VENVVTLRALSIVGASLALLAGSSGCGHDEPIRRPVERDRHGLLAETVVLPVVREGTTREAGPRAIVLSVTAEGRIYVKRKEYTVGDLRYLVEPQCLTRPGWTGNPTVDRGLLIRCHSRAAFQSLRNILDFIGSSGCENVVLATRPGADGVERGLGLYLQRRPSGGDEGKSPGASRLLCRLERRGEDTSLVTLVIGGRTARLDEVDGPPDREIRLQGFEALLRLQRRSGSGEDAEPVAVECDDGVPVGHLAAVMAAIEASGAGGVVVGFRVE